MDESLISGFSDGVVTPASITITPGGMVASDADLSSSLYAFVDLPRMLSPTLGIDSSEAHAGLSRLSGGERIATIETSQVGGDRFELTHAVMTQTDLVFTVVASSVGIKVDLNLFDQFFAWITAIRHGDSITESLKTVSIKTVPLKGEPSVDVEYPNALPARINFVNPSLVNPVNHVAPYTAGFQGSSSTAATAAVVNRLQKNRSL